MKDNDNVSELDQKDLVTSDELLDYVNLSKYRWILSEPNMPAPLSSLFQKGSFRLFKLNRSSESDPTRRDYLFVLTQNDQHILIVVSGCDTYREQCHIG